MSISTFTIGVKGLMTDGFMTASSGVVECDPIDFNKLPGGVRTTIENAENENDLPGKNEMIVDPQGNEYTYDDSEGTGDWMIEGPSVNSCVFTRTIGLG